MLPAGEQVVDALDPVHGVVSLENDSRKEIGQPFLPFSPLRHAEKACVIFLTGGLEVGAKIEQGRGNYAPFDQQQRDEQTSHPSIAVKKGMDRFKLGMG